MNNDARRLAELVKEYSGTFEAEENGNDCRPRTAQRILVEAYKLAKKVLEGTTAVV